MSPVCYAFIAIFIVMGVAVLVAVHAVESGGYDEVVKR